MITEMNVYALLLLSIIGSVVSLAGGALMLSNKRLAARVAIYAGPFAAGALVAAVFVDLLPEALENSTADTGAILLWTVAGILLFFLLERRLRWFHHHHSHGDDSDLKRIRPMLVIGDTIHNAIDGVAIAFAYLTDPSAGVVTTFAIAMHELPQEIGDFGLLLQAGYSRRKVLILNVLSALATVVAAMLTYFFGRHFEDAVAPALALTAGTLLYIACSDIIPSVHESSPGRKWIDIPGVLFILGIVVVTAGIFLARGLEG